jgi:predicted NACHT family NTPase
MTIELHLEERTDVIASSASLVFYHFETGEVSPPPLGTSIIQAYDRVQRGLLLLGAPGSGKTTLLLSLARELLQRAENDLDQPLTIILNLSNWARTQLPLAQWLGEQCSLVYGISKQLTAALIAQEQVQFLLDGLDEMEASALTACITAINTYRQAHLVPLVVCSRRQEYESQPARLILPAAIEIQPLDLAQVSKVLNQEGTSLATVRATLRSNAILNNLLTTPLMLSIVLLTYRDKTAKELPQSGSPKEQQREIFEQYVQRMLQRYQQRRIFSMAQTSRSLTWLARQMQQHHMAEFYLESLQVDWLKTSRSRITYRIFFGLVGCLVVGLLFGLIGGLLFGLIGGLTTAALFGDRMETREHASLLFLAQSQIRLEMCRNLL